MLQKLIAFFKREEQYVRTDIHDAELFVETVADRVAEKVIAAVKRDLAKIKAAIPPKKK